MIVLLQIAGDVALLLMGVRYLRKGLDRLFGQQLGSFMRRIGSRKGLSFVSGIVLSMIAPSSTTMSVLAVQTVQGGYMNARQMLAVMLGANIGLTILVQLVALQLDQYATVFIAVGFVLFQYTGSGRARGVGQIILSLGFFFLAMFAIKSTLRFNHMESNANLHELIEMASDNPIWLALVAMVIATLLQSATATIGLVIGMGELDALGMPIIIPVIIGANVGLGITGLLFGWRQLESRRLGMANLALKAALGALCMVALPWLVPLAARMPGELAMRVANLHTGFNVLRR